MRIRGREALFCRAKIIPDFFSKTFGARTLKNNGSATKIAKGTKERLKKEKLFFVTFVSFVATLFPSPSATAEVWPEEGFSASILAQTIIFWPSLAVWDRLKTTTCSNTRSYGTGPVILTQHGCQGRLWADSSAAKEAKTIASRPG
jgi:hypothetical protein